jgi:hypothetical protein
MLVALIRTMAGVWQFMSPAQKEAFGHEGSPFLRFMEPVAGTFPSVESHEMGEDAAEDV